MNIRRTFPLVAIAAVAMIAAMLAGPTQPSAQSPKWDTVTDSVLPVSNQPSTGPGYKPAPASNTCNCGDFAALEKRVATLETKIASYGAARPTTTNGSAGVNTSTVTYQSPPVYYSPQQTTTTYRSAPVTYQAQPATTTVRTGLFGRRYQTYSAPQSCRIVNGVRVCN